MFSIEPLKERIGLYIHKLILNLEVLHIFFFLREMGPSPMLLLRHGKVSASPPEAPPWGG